MTVIDLSGGATAGRRRFARRFRRSMPAPSTTPRRDTGAGRRAATAQTVRGTSTSQRLGMALIVIVVVLSLLGSVMVLSASSVTALSQEGSSFAVFLKQCMWLLLGTVALIVGARLDHQRLLRWVPAMVLATLAMLVAVKIPGVGISVNGSQRWLGIGSFRIQPAEPATFALIAFCAAVISRNRAAIADHRVVLRPVAVVGGIYMLLLLAQPKYGTAALMCIIVAGMLVYAGLPWRIVALLGAVVGMLAPLGIFLADYRLDRITAFRDPWGNADSAGYQTIQSLIGVASGGVSGTGLGASRAKWGFLPEAHTDFVFAIVGEELGLIGSLFVVGLFAALVGCGLAVASRARDDFGQILAIGIVLWISIQAFVNMGAVLNLLPITGVPLPFVSFGGASLLTTMFAAGVLVNIALRGEDRPDPVRQRIAARRAGNGERARRTAVAQTTSRQTTGRPTAARR